jgi:hypothetical protein
MEILSQTEIIEQVGGWPEGVVIGIFAILFLAVSFFFAFVLDFDTLGIMGGFIITICTLLLTIGIWSPKDVPTGRYEYKIILDENYPAVQLYEKYEVVGQDGKIWIIQEKESKD